MEFSDLVPIAAIIIAFCAIIVTTFNVLKLIHQNDNYIKKIDSNELKLLELDKREKNSLELHTILTEIQKSLTRNIDSNYLAIENLFEHQGLDYSFFDEESAPNNLKLEKLSCEIRLFSIDNFERISAQRTLANYSGDEYSLRLMYMIRDKELGQYDPEIEGYSETLCKRLGLDRVKPLWIGSKKS